MTLAGIEPATFRFVAQHLKHCATAVPVTNVPAHAKENVSPLPTDSRLKINQESDNIFFF